MKAFRFTFALLMFLPLIAFSEISDFSTSTDYYSQLEEEDSSIETESSIDEATYSFTEEETSSYTHLEPYPFGVDGCEPPELLEGFDFGSVPVDESVTMPFFEFVDLGNDILGESFFWELPEGECISHIEVNLPFDSEEPYLFESSVRLVEVSGRQVLVVNRPGPYLARVNGRIYSLLASTFTGNAGIGTYPGNGRIPAGACIETATRRERVWINTQNILRTDPVNPPPDGLVRDVASYWWRWPRVGSLAGAIAQINAIGGNTTSMTFMSHGGNSMFAFGRPSVDRTLNVRNVDNFLNGINKNLSKLVLFACCSGNVAQPRQSFNNTGKVQDLLALLTRQGSPVTEACGSTRFIMTSRNRRYRRTYFGFGRPRLVRDWVSTWVERGSWRCVRRQGN